MRDLSHRHSKITEVKLELKLKSKVFKRQYDGEMKNFRKALTKKMKNEPEIPTSYPKMSPLDAATRQVMTTERVILPAKPLTGGDKSTGTTSPAIFISSLLKLHFTSAFSTVSAIPTHHLIPKYSSSVVSGGTILQFFFL